jgi:hypothetical protein
MCVRVRAEGYKQSKIEEPWNLLLLRGETRHTCMNMAMGLGDMGKVWFWVIYLTVKHSDNEP